MTAWHDTRVAAAARALAGGDPSADDLASVTALEVRVMRDAQREGGEA